MRAVGVVQEATDLGPVGGAPGSITANEIRRVRVRLRVNVTPMTEQSFELEREVRLVRRSVPRVGASIPVLYDPKHHARFELGAAARATADSGPLSVAASLLSTMPSVAASLSASPRSSPPTAAPPPG